MDKSQCIDQFWNSFGWKAYDESTVPEDVTMPYISYTVSLDNLGNPVMMDASLWDYTRSWETVSKKVDEISEAIDHQYPPAIAIDGGRVYITKGTPFAQRVSDSSNTMVRRIHLNLEVEFFTET